MKQDNMNLQSGSTSAGKSNNQWSTPVSVEQMEADITDTAKQFYADFIAYAGDSLRMANKKASSLIRHYPVEAAAGALTVGVVLGALIFRRRV